MSVSIRRRFVLTLFADSRKESSLVRFDLELEQSRTSSYPLKKIAFSCFSRKFDAKSGGNAISSDFRINSMFFVTILLENPNFLSNPELESVSGF